MSVIQQIAKLIEQEGITVGALERTIGASKGVLSRAMAQGTDIQSKWVQEVVENYPQYNPFWLLTGKGSMLQSPPPPLPRSPSCTT